jgi:phosphatidylserine/phosphatidylglycerophosphate/cardiolipin synthase-like enzyme
MTVFGYKFGVEQATVTAVIESKHQHLCASIDGIGRLLALAADLRRTNAAKWGLSLRDWLASVKEVLTNFENREGDSLQIVEAVRAARSAVRRLANSGEARFDSASVGRDPDSSNSGRRFYDDLERLHHRLALLRGLEQRRTKRST